MFADDTGQLPVVDVCPVHPVGVWSRSNMTVVRDKGKRGICCRNDAEGYQCYRQPVSGPEPQGMPTAYICNCALDTQHFHRKLFE